MAVVFISPKQRQKIFFEGITIVFVLFLIVISVGVFSSVPKEVSPTLVFNKPKVNIDMGVFDSDQFKNLQPFVTMETQYSYKAQSKDKKIKTGFMAAGSAEQVKTVLKDMGLVVLEIKEIEIGRDNPFIPYYRSVVAPATGTRTIK